jgi:hypothetical protein
MRFIVVLGWSIAVVGGVGCSDQRDYVTLSTSLLTFVQDWGSDPDPSAAAQTVTITFHGDGLIVGYPPGVMPASWLGLSIPPVADPKGTELQVVARSTGLPPGAYSTPVRIVTGKIDGSVVVYKDITVELTVRDTLTAAVDDPSIGGRVGAAQFTNVSSISVKEYGAWTAAVDQPWLQLSATAGSGDQLVTVAAAASASALGPGHHAATVTITGGDPPQSARIEIDLAMDALRWWSERWAVALTKVAGVERLSDTVRLEATGDPAAMGFTALSDAAWLTANLTGGALTLTADPTGLPDGLQLASVTVTSSAQTATPTQTIRVALYKLGTAVATQSTVPVLAGEGVTPFGMVVDPLRPVVYVGADHGGAIEGYNVYTGARVLATAPPQAHQVLWQATPDGRSLLTRSYTVATGTWGDTIVSYDLDSATWGAPSTARVDEATPEWNIDGVELHYRGGLFDADGNAYDKNGGFGFNLAPFSQVFADPQGTHWVALQPGAYSTTGGRFMSLDSFNLAVYQLARKVGGYSRGKAPDSTVYVTEGPIVGVPNVPPPPAQAALRSRDAYPQVSNNGSEFWVPGGIYAGWLALDPSFGFGPIRFLNFPNTASASVQALSVTRDGRAIAIWPGPQGAVVARYTPDGTLSGSELLSPDAPGIAGGANLGAMLKHAADDLRVITVRDAALVSPPANMIGFITQ